MELIVDYGYQRLLGIKLPENIPKTFNSSHYHMVDIGGVTEHSKFNPAI